MMMLFPEVIDNTIRKAFMECPTRAMYRHVKNLRPNGPDSVDLHFGSCFATGMEYARKWFFGSEPLSAQSAIQAGIDAAAQQYGDFVCPVGKYKSKDRLVGALRYYFNQWPLGEDGLTPLEGGIECSFAIDIPVKHPVTGEWLKYAGKYDMRAITPSGRIVVVDEKTASRLGDTWSMQWDLDSQMTGYIWSVRQTHPVEDVEVMAQIRAVSILKNDYGHAEVDVVRSKWMVRRWYEQMLCDVMRMKRSFERNEWDMALHANSCASYNRQCEFSQLCCNPTPERIINDGVSYREEVWSPLKEVKPK